MENLKSKASSLSRAIATLGLPALTATQALEVVSRMEGHRNWQTARAAGQVGLWNEAQAAIYAAFPNADLLATSIGSDYSKAGNGLFEVVMDQAGRHPRTRAIGVLEFFVDYANKLLTSVHASRRVSAPWGQFKLPQVETLEPAFARFLQVELVDELSVENEPWVEVGRRIETIRQELYSSLLALYQVGQPLPDSVMILDSSDGIAWAFAVGVTSEMDRETAEETAATVIQILFDRQNASPEQEQFDFSRIELEAVLATKGFIVFKDSFVGPCWD